MSRAARGAPSQTGQNDRVSSAFPRASRSELGYRPEEVDAFLERARVSFEERDESTSRVTSSEIRRTAFRVQRRGYSARFVDAAMDRLEEVFFERERRTRMRELGEEAWWSETRQLLSEIRGRLTRPRGRRFHTRGLFASGYRRSEVDAFLDRVGSMLAGRGALSCADVRSVVFHSEWRGYDEDQVDALLDAVVEVILATR